MKDHYKILGIDPAASQDAIKKAYRMLALKHHPDRNGGNAASEARFKEISESYLILGDISKRQSYDDWRYGRTSPPPAEEYASKNVTPVTFLIMFRNIRERVFNAGGYINEKALFDIINGVLTTENLNYLVLAADVRTNSLIIDEILISSVFLRDSSKTVLYRKLIRLAHGDEKLRKKIAVLSYSTDRPKPQPETEEEGSMENYAYFFILMVLAIIFLAVMLSQ